MRRLWLIEIWEEHREHFKALIGHVLFFLLLLGALILIGYLIKISSLDEDQKRVLEIIDFYAIVLTIVLLAIGYIVRAAILIFRGLRSERS